MRSVSVTDLKPGMILARTIVNDDLIVVLAENTELTPSHIKRLTTLDVPFIYIKDEYELSSNFLSVAALFNPADAFVSEYKEVVNTAKGLIDTLTKGGDEQSVDDVEGLVPFKQAPDGCGHGLGASAEDELLHAGSELGGIGEGRRHGQDGAYLRRAARGRGGGGLEPAKLHAGGLADEGDSLLQHADIERRARRGLVGVRILLTAGDVAAGPAVLAGDNPVAGHGVAVARGIGVEDGEVEPCAEGGGAVVTIKLPLQEN